MIGEGGAERAGSIYARLLPAAPFQVRYIVLLFLTYPLALVFRYLLHPSRVSPTVRHLFAVFFGVSFGLICFGM